MGQDVGFIMCSPRRPIRNTEACTGECGYGSFDERKTAYLRLE